MIKERNWKMRKIKELRKIEIKKRSAKYEKTKGSAKKDKKEITAK